MANLDFGQDILAYVLRHAGVILPTVPAGHADVGNADRLIDTKLGINQAYWEIVGLKSWRFARKRVQFASIGSDAVTVSSISAATPAVVTLSATIATTRAGRKFYMDGEGIPHRIAAHTAGTNLLTLATAYVGQATTGAGTIFQDEISIGQTDILAFPDLVQLTPYRVFDLIPENQMRAIAPRNTWGGTYTCYGSFLDASTVRLAPWTERPTLFELAYNRHPPALTFDGTANDVPILPQAYRVVIADRALERLYPAKRDGRGQQMSAFTSDTYNRMVSHELSFAKPRTFVPPGRSIAGH